MNRNWNCVLSGTVMAAGGFILAWGSLMTQALADKADLAVHSITVTNTAALSNTVTVIDVTTNRAVTGLAGASTTYIYLCTNLTSWGLSNIASHSVSLLQAGRSQWNTSNIVIPGTQPLGTNRFIVIVDKPNIVVESNEGNNTNSVLIEITP